MLAKLLLMGLASLVHPWLEIPAAGEVETPCAAGFPQGRKSFFPASLWCCCCCLLQIALHTVEPEQGEKESLAGSCNIAACSTPQPRGNTFTQQHFVLATGTGVSTPATGLQVPSSKMIRKGGFPTSPSNIKMYHVSRMVFGRRSVNLFSTLVLQRQKQTAVSLSPGKKWQ